MRVTTTTVVADRGRSNEDFVGAVPTAAVVVDGAFIPGAEGACRHGVAWYAHRLGADLLSLVECAGDETLPALLAAAIEQVTDAHGHTCDPADPRSPWAAVAMVRVRHGLVEHLVLGDATVCSASCEPAETTRVASGRRRTTRARPTRRSPGRSRSANCEPSP